MNRPKKFLPIFSEVNPPPLGCCWVNKYTVNIQYSRQKNTIKQRGNFPISTKQLQLFTSNNNRQQRHWKEINIVFCFLCVKVDFLPTQLPILISPDNRLLMLYRKTIRRLFQKYEWQNSTCEGKVELKTVKQGVSEETSLHR